MKKGMIKMCAVLLAITCFASGFVACGETMFSSNGTENSTSSENGESNENSESNGSSSSSPAEEGESLNRTRLTIGVEESDYGYEWLGKLIDIHVNIFAVDGKFNLSVFDVVEYFAECFHDKLSFLMRNYTAIAKH